MSTVIIYSRKPDVKPIILEYNPLYLEENDEHIAQILYNIIISESQQNRVKRKRWLEAEPFIMKSPQWAHGYAHNVIEGRWPEAEPYIMKSPEYASHYADYVIKGRWPEAEPYIKQDTYWWKFYAYQFKFNPETGKEKEKTRAV